MYQINPSKSLKDQILSIPNAVMVKQKGAYGPAFPARVYDQEQKHIETADCYIGLRKLETRPISFPNNVEIPITKGNWVYAGTLWEHFGHFLTDSLSRLWVFDHIDMKIDGIVFFSKFPVDQAYSDKVADQLKTMFGFTYKLKFIEDCDQFENLIVAPSGCGTRDNLIGSPDFRQFMQNNVVQYKNPNSPKKIYISRSAFYQTELRGVLKEDLLEKYIAEQGFHMYQPEKHSLQHQIETYQNAEMIVGLDGTPFHLVVFTANRMAKLAIIKRRYSRAFRLMTKQARWFGFKNPMAIGHCVSYWAKAGSLHDSHLVSEIDFKKIGTELKQGEFIESDEGFKAMTRDEVETELLNCANSLSTDFHEVQKNTDLRDKPLMIGKKPQLIPREKL